MSDLTPGDPLQGAPKQDAPITPPAPERPFEPAPAAPGWMEPSEGYTTPAPPGAGGPAPTAPVLPAGGGQLVLAGYGARAGAYIIDALIIGMVALLIMAPLGVGFFATDSDTGVVALIISAILGFLVFAVVALMYAPVMMWRTNGKTIGRMAVGTRVVRANGQPMTFGTAILREVVIKSLAVGIASSIIPLLPWLVDLLWPLWDDENRALHDFPTDTRTIRD